ncbi:MAG TPA: hypothetical protein PK867_04840, partial [Pirellulales bacterium]|nr:hypothetical protein [Pirellulales bacterium]
MQVVRLEDVLPYVLAKRAEPSVRIVRTVRVVRTDARVANRLPFAAPSNIMRLPIQFPSWRKSFGSMRTKATARTK